jgi:cell division transport system ATP-binding protein
MGLYSSENLRLERPPQVARQELPQTNSVIQCFHIYKSYVRGQDVFHDASVEIEKGEFVFLMGTSGAGKTTFVRLLLGLEPVTRGYVVIEGRNLQRLPKRELPYLRRRMGVVFQDFKLLQRRTVFENVALPLEVVGKPRSFIRKKISQVLRFVELENKASVPCCRLSGGEQQRVAIARAVVNSPPILIADEPTGNLDEWATQDVMNLFKHVHLLGGTVLLATHDRYLLSLVPKGRVLEIHQGRILPQTPSS